jgi:hypothetical protein
MARKPLIGTVAANMAEHGTGAINIDACWIPTDDAASAPVPGTEAKFQLRDLRAKADTDKAEASGDIMQARDQLGHTTVVMTEQYIRDRGVFQGSCRVSV